MATTLQTRPVEPPPASRLEAPAERKQIRPVVGWAAVGALYLAFIAYTLIHWIVSGQAHRTVPVGHAPTWMRIEIIGFETVLPVVTVWMIWKYVVKPRRQNGVLSIEGMYLITFVTMYFQDLWMNYLTPVAYFNSYFVNLGSWYSALPGWVSPNTHLNPEPIVANIPYYVLGGFAPTLAGIIFYKKIAKRWPRMGTATGLVALYAFFMLFDVLMEGIAVVGGAYNYLPNLPGPALFKGHHYQLPIWEPIFWGAVWTGGAALLMFRDDHGHTLAERGLDRVRGSRRRKEGIQLLAMIGAMNVMMIVLFAIPWNILSSQAGRIPRDTPSYILNGICGPGTRYQCSSPDSPIQREGAPAATRSAYPAGYFQNQAAMIRSAHANGS